VAKLKTTKMNLQKIQNAVQKVVKRQRFARNIKSVSVFGSAVRGEMNAQSDVDLIVEFFQTMSLLDRAGLKNDFEKELKHKVDLLTPKVIHPRLKKNILNSAKKIYGR
jgi:uncharacterized protein